MPRPVDEQEYLKDFYRALNPRPIDPNDSAQRERYVSVYAGQAPHVVDPVEKFARTFRFQEPGVGIVVLFSGYRGTGKSTELRRLKRALEERQEAIVVYCDLADHINTDAPPDVPDLLLSTAGAFAEELAKDPVLSGGTPLGASYWQRVVDYLRRTDVEVDDVVMGAGVAEAGAKIQLALKTSPTFQQRVQQHLSANVGALVEEVRSFYAEQVARIRATHADREVVILFDSLEHIRGTSTTAADVARHLEAVFSRVDLLRIPGVHVVYTVPPWLKIRAPEVFQSFDASLVIPCIKVETRGAERQPWAPGIQLLREVVKRRGDWARLVTQAQLDRIILASGGYFRDLFRILVAVIHRVADRGLPADDAIVEAAIADVRNSYLPLAQADAAWLAEVERTGEAQLPAQEALGDLARFFDHHYVLTYRNGEEWYAPHPLLREAIGRGAKGGEA